MTAMTKTRIVRKLCEAADEVKADDTINVAKHFLPMLSQLLTMN